MDPTRNESNVYIHYMPAPSTQFYNIPASHTDTNIWTTRHYHSSSRWLQLKYVYVHPHLRRCSSNLDFDSYFSNGSVQPQTCICYMLYVIEYVYTYNFKWEWSLFQYVNHCFILIGCCWFSTSSLATWAWPSTLHLHQPTDRFNCFAKPTERLRTWKPISPKNAPCII